MCSSSFHGIDYKTRFYISSSVDYYSPDDDIYQVKSSIVINPFLVIFPLGYHEGAQIHALTTVTESVRCVGDPAWHGIKTSPFI